jgi:hypothetical protein
MSQYRSDLATIYVKAAKENDMGGLIPIGGGADAEIKGRLNAAFDDTNIVIVRGQHTKEGLFDGNHKLHRLAYRLGAYPIRTYKGESAKAQGKWFFFLKKTLKDPAIQSITAILRYAMVNANNNVARVVFDARPGDPNANPDHYVDGPSHNPTSNADITGLVDSSGTLLLALICPESLSMNTSPVPNQSGDVDAGEKPPAKIFTPTLLAPPRLNKNTRKPKK